MRLAAAGERVLVTDRDRVLAAFTAPRAGSAETVTDAVLAGLVRPGLATPPLLRQPRSPRTRGTLALAKILVDLDHDRAER